MSVLKFHKRAALAATLLSFAAGVSSAEAPAKSDPAVTGDAANVLILSLACRTENTTKDVMAMLIARDLEAFKKAMMRHGLNGECVLIDKGDTVFVTDLAIWQGLARVRKKGAVDSYWVDHSFIARAAKPQ